MPSGVIRRTVIAGAIAAPAIVGEIGYGHVLSTGEDDSDGRPESVDLWSNFGDRTVPAETGSIQTSGYAAVGRGAATYFATTNIGETAWRKQSANGRWFELGGDSVAPEQVGAAGDGVADDSAALTAALSLGRPVRGQPEAQYRIANKVYVADKNIDLDLRGAVLIDATKTGQGLHLHASPTKVVPVTSITTATANGARRSVLSVVDVSGVAAGDVLKIYSDDLISTKANERMGEFAEVLSVSDGAITLSSILLLPMATTIRYAVLNRALTCKVKGITFDTAMADGVVRGFPYCLNVEGYVGPHISDIHGRRALGILVMTQSCYRAFGEGISADYLRDAVDRGGFGYGVADYGSQYSIWRGLNFNTVRHAYTTGANETPVANANPYLYGGAVRCRVESGRCLNPTNYAWDTHEDAWECSFGEVEANAARRDGVRQGGGAQDRGTGTIYDRLTVYGGDDGTSARNGFAMNFRCNTHIREFNYFGSGSALNCFASAVSRLRVDVMNVALGKSLPLALWSSSTAMVDIGELNIHVAPGPETIALNPQARLFRMNGGNLSVESLTWHLQGLPSGRITGAPTLVWLEGPTSDIIIKRHLLEVDDNTAAMLKTTILNGGGPGGENCTFNRFRCETLVHYPTFTALPNSGGADVFNYIINASGGRVLHAFDVEGRAVQLSFSQTSQAILLTRGDPNNTIYFSPNRFPWRLQQFPLVYDHIYKRIECHASAARISAVPPPAFEGQRLTFAAGQSSDAVATVYDVVVLSTAAGMQLTSDLSIAKGAQAEFVGKRDADALKWALL